jgi:hypothetical protein
MTELHPRPVRNGPSRRTLAVAAAVVIGVFGLSDVGVASSQVGPTSSASVTLAQARSARERANSRLQSIREQRERVQARLDDLGAADAAITTDLADARGAVRELAVAAYIDGGKTELTISALDPEKAMALAWRRELMSDQTSNTREAIDRYEALRRDNDPDRVKAAEELDRLAAMETQAVNDAIQAAALERDAEAAADRQAAAEAEASRQAAARAEAARQATTTTAKAAPGPKPTTSVTPKPKASTSTTAKAPTSTVAAPAPSKPSYSGTEMPILVPTGPTGGTGPATAQEADILAKIRFCETRNNYAAVSASGRYRGAYQFDQVTWEAIGGTGDPAAASPAQQDARALALLRMRGTAPWPTCRRG